MFSNLGIGNVGGSCRIYIPYHWVVSGCGGGFVVAAVVVCSSYLVVRLLLWHVKFIVLMIHQVLRSNMNRTLDIGGDVKFLFYCQWFFVHVEFFIDFICDFCFVFSFPLLVTWLLFKLSPITQLVPVLSRMQSNCLAMNFYLSCCFVILMYTSEMKGIDFCWTFVVACLEFILNQLGWCHRILPSWSMKEALFS